MIHLTNEKPVVLFLDDEIHNLNAFKASFRRVFSIFLAQTPSEAREILLNEEIEVILSDQRMPAQNGTDFFQEIIGLHPEPVRILLTGYVDIKAVIDAINKGEVYRFLQKPWNDEEVKITIKNAAEIYRTKKELALKNDMLEKAYAELDQFVYSASHDLRSPIASIKGVLNLIELEPQNKDAYIDMIKHISNKMDKYVINIINYYRSSRFESKVTKVNPRLIVSEIIEEFQFMPEYKNLRLETYISVDDWVYTDPIKLNLICRNIIHNAIKYHDSSKQNPYVIIEIDYNNNLLTIKVKDNGIGIAEKEIGKIFDMFQRANTIKSGVGLGLYIVKQCIDKLNGRITFESTHLEGTKFDITIPCQEDSKLLDNRDMEGKQAINSK